MVTLHSEQVHWQVNSLVGPHSGDKEITSYGNRWSKSLGLEVKSIVSTPAFLCVMNLGELSAFSAITNGRTELRDFLGPFQDPPSSAWLDGSTGLGEP